MKAAPKVVLLFKDADGFATAISDGLQPNPSSPFPFRRLDDSFELSLDQYGIKDQKGSGNIVHFVDADGLQQVSILLLPKYEPPILACAVNEVLASLVGENSSTMPTLILPYFVAALNLKLENKHLSHDKISLHGFQIGPETDTTRALLTSTQKLPPSLQIHHETLACLLQLVRVLKMPTFVLLGQSDQSLSPTTFGEEVEVIYEMGKILASTLSLCFSRERIAWTPTKTSREHKEPWRALYG